MRKNRMLVLIIILTSSVCWSDRIDLESYASGFDSIPIAVLKFRPQQGSRTIENDQPWKVIADDFDFHDKFHVVRVEKADSVKFVREGVGLFIDGEYYVENDNVVLDCYLHDASTMDLLLGKKYRGEMKYLRSMSHRYANNIVEVLLNERGPFESRIVFVVDKGAEKNIFIVDYDGYCVKQLTREPTVNIFPAFIDSSVITWTGFSRGKPDLYKGSTETGKYSIFVYSRYVETSPSYSAITGRLAYASSCNGNMDIYTCDAGGGNKKQLTFKRSIDTSPSWSPNGYQIAFTSDRSGQPQIYLMDADGVNQRRITFEGSYQDSPSWSPKGDKIAYASLQNGKFDIWTIGADGTGAVQVTSCPGNNEYPSWSPDGSHIVFSSKRGGKSDLYVVRPDGTRLKKITTMGNARMPDWSHF